eukprot:scaffold22120_cov163-Isochrysis_galbana.AAC.2
MAVDPASAATVPSPAPLADAGGEDRVEALRQQVAALQREVEVRRLEQQIAMLSQQMAGSDPQLAAQAQAATLAQAGPAGTSPLGESRIPAAPVPAGAAVVAESWDEMD